MRGGKLNSSEFGDRMTGSGEFARQIQGMFVVFLKKYGLDGGLPSYDCSKFRRPTPKTGQLWLF